MTKTDRQLSVIDKWINSNYVGGLQATTGFGKTYTAILGIKKINPKSIIVIVPTLILKQQWTEELNKNKIVNFDVIVVNTASKNNYNCDLLIIDEAHSVLAPTFKLIFDTVKYEKLFWLTATVERNDGEHKLLLQKAPIIDTVTLDECLANKWVSEYQVYNLEVPFSKDEQIAYNKADNSFKYFAMKLGYNSFDTAKKWLSSGTKEEKGIAGSYYNSMRKRKQIITGNSNKINFTLDIINMFGSSKYIIFSEAIEFVDRVTILEDSCIGIHSKMTKKQQLEAMKQFNDGRTKKRGIASCKALTTGLDIPTLDLGIVASFNSSKLINTQTIGNCTICRV